MRCLSAVWCVVLCLATAMGQQKKDVPPPPKPEDKGTSLEVTMKFIQDKLNIIGPVGFTVTANDPAGPWSEIYRHTLSNVVADAGTCRISYHWKEDYWNSVNHYWNSVNQEKDVTFFLKDGADMQVMTLEQNLIQIDNATGHPGRTYSVEPTVDYRDQPYTKPGYEVFVLKVNLKDKAQRGNSDSPFSNPDEFHFYDEDLPNRIARALTHAIELCGGGIEPGPFLQDSARAYDEQLKNAMALWKNNQVSAASNAAAALIKFDPNRWEGYGLAGAIEKAQNKLPEAKAAYRREL